MEITPVVGLLVTLIVVILIIVVAAFALTRRGRRRGSLPEHTPIPSAPPAQSWEPSESRVDLGSRPPEQVVIREVAKVNCKYCGTLIPTTADKCPYCGGPRE
jgi:hypothetical protein